MAEPSDDVLAFVSHLDLMHQVGFGEYRAAGSDIRWFLGGEGDVSEFLHFHTKAVGLAREERARSRSAEGVHGVIYRNAIGNADDLGILTAYLKDGAHIRMQMGGAYRMGRYLILHDRGPEHGSHETSGASRGACAHDAHLFCVALGSAALS